MREFGYRLYRLGSAAEVADGVKLLVFESVHDHMEPPSPGSYVMVHVPFSGDVPLSVFDYSRRDVSFLVSDYGGPSTSLYALKPESWVWIRGPLGHGFKYVEGENYLLVGGGVGVSPLLFFAKANFMGNRGPFKLAVGARTSAKLIPVEELSKGYVTPYLATDDGSRGHRGSVFELASALVDEHQVTQVCVCGPEPLLRAVLQLCVSRRLGYQGSFVRDVRCAYGVCGSCVVEGTGKLVCVDGPVFDKAMLTPVG